MRFYYLYIMNEQMKYYIELNNKVVTQIWSKIKKDNYYLWKSFLEINEEKIFSEDNLYEITKDSFEKLMLEYISIIDILKELN